MTDVQALIERCRQAAAPGVPVAHRRRVLLEAADYLARMQQGGQAANNRPPAAA